MSCAKSRKQCGRAMHNYKETNGAAPGSRVTVGADAKFRSWTPLALAYVEQDNAGKLWDLNTKWNQGTNLTTSQIRFKLFVCPSAPAGRRVSPGAPPPGPGDYGSVNASRRRH